MRYEVSLITVTNTIRTQHVFAVNTIHGLTGICRAIGSGVQTNQPIEVFVEDTEKGGTFAFSLKDYSGFHVALNAIEEALLYY